MGKVPNLIFTGLHPYSIAIIGSLTLGLFFTGCGNKSAPAAAAPEVLTVTVSPQAVPIYKEWIGTLDGYVNAQIRAQVTGYLLTQNYLEGSQVKQGDLLFQIDPRPFQAALDQANGKLAQDEAQQSRTQWDVERYAPLAKKSAISQQEYNDAVQANLAALAQLKADHALVEAAQLNLEFTKITSPIDGLAGIALSQIGDLVGPGGPVLTTVSTIDPIKVHFTASEQSYLAYRRQFTNETERATHEQSVELQLILADGTAYPHPGRFFFASREVNPTTGTIQLTGLFPNPSLVLRPGQFARVRAKTQTRTDALLVPQRAVTQLQGSFQVEVVQPDNKVHIQTVTVGDRIGTMWLIEKGLRPGDRVVVEGILKANKEGMGVTPRPYTGTNEISVASSP